MIKKVNFAELKNENFTIIPIPFEDELFSSWLIRTAYAHQTHPHTFANQYFNYRKHSFFITESDISLSSAMVQSIQEKSGYKINVKSLMLTTYSGYIQDNIHDNSPTTFFTHQKYCPICLREDKVPYFRKRWRVVFYNICHKHQCYMYECCPKCKIKLSISKMYKNKLPYTYCHNCGFELRKARKLPLRQKYISSLNYQNKIFNILEDGHIKLENVPIYSFLFFKVFSRFSKLILMNNKYELINKHCLFPLIAHAQQQRINHPIFKKVNARTQAALFGLIMYIFDDFPHNLEAYIIGNRLTYRALTTKIRDIPFWYEKIVNEIVPQYPQHGVTVTKEEVENAKCHLKSIGKPINKANLTLLLGCNFYSKDNNLHTYLEADGIL